nr:glycosyltransferase [uncultured Sphaerochaeta sp.]
MSNKKSIIIYAGKFELPDRNAEAQRVMANAKAFREKGYTVIFVGITHDPILNISFLDTQCVYEGFKSYSRPYPKSILQWVRYSIDSPEVRELIKIFNDEVATVILYNYPAIATLEILHICKKNKIKVFSDCTEWYAPFTKHKKPSLIKFIDTELRMRIINKRVDGILVISKYLNNYYMKSLPTFLIPPLVDKQDNKWNTPRQVDINQETIVYAGSPGKKDRLDLVVSAVLKSELPINLIVIGVTQQEFLTMYRNFCKEEIGKIDFLGRLSHAEVIASLRRADHTCFFRDNTRMSNAGFPTKFVESISAGVPVITNSTSDIKFYADQIGSCVVIEDINSDSIVKSLKLAITLKKTAIPQNFFDYRNYHNEFENIVALF